MLIFKIIITFLTICVYKSNELSFKQKTYYTSVVGGITCRYFHNGTAVVLLSNNRRTTEVKSPLDFRVIKYGGMFQLFGKIRSHWVPHLYFKIIHKCFKSKHIKKKVFIRRIPSKFIEKSRLPKLSWFLGTLELSELN